MTWHVQYTRGTVDHIEEYPNPEAAIEAMCLLIDEGCDVYGLGTGPLNDSVDRDRIARIYDIWARARLPGRR